MLKFLFLNRADQFKFPIVGYSFWNFGEAEAHLGLLELSFFSLSPLFLISSRSSPVRVDFNPLKINFHQ